MEKAFLLHPTEHMNGNLRWHLRNESVQDKISASLNKICSLGYWASPFREGDGITFSKEDYSAEQALEDFKNSFEWIEIEECKRSDFPSKMAEILKRQKYRCTVLVPIRKLWIENSFKIGDFKFWPPMEKDGFSASDHPLFKYCASPSFFESEGQALGQWDGEITREEDLLRYPLIEVNINMDESELLGIANDLNAQIRLLKIASQQADRALDLLRINSCHFKKIEYLPDRAGQLANGFTVAYFIPELRQYKETLLQHIVYPIRTSNNWLGLEAEYTNDPYLEWLAGILKGDVNNEIEMAIRSSIIALSQAFYITYEEVSFLALIFALDGLCLPDANWKAWKHRSYIAAISSGGDIHIYEQDLKIFEYIYSDIRNKLVHSGASFSDIENADFKSVAASIHSLIIRCITVIYQENISSKKELHNLAKKILSQKQFEDCTNKIIDYYDTLKGKVTHFNQRPKW